MKNSPLQLATYIKGFVLSIVLTLTAYLFVQRHITSAHTAYPHGILIGIIVGLALLQLLVQLFFFLHLGEESRPYFKLSVFISMLGVVIILVFGSLWIMYHLNYNMTPDQMNSIIMEDEGLHH